MDSRGSKSDWVCLPLFEDGKFREYPSANGLAEGCQVELTQIQVMGRTYIPSVWKPLARANGRQPEAGAATDLLHWKWSQESGWLDRGTGFLGKGFLWVILHFAGHLTTGLLKGQSYWALAVARNLGIFKRGFISLPGFVC